MYRWPSHFYGSGAQGFVGILIFCVSHWLFLPVACSRQANDNATPATKQYEQAAATPARARGPKPAAESPKNKSAQSTDVSRVPNATRDSENTGGESQDDPRISLVQQLNEAIQWCAESDKEFQYVGFTFEKSTGKLWWSRLMAEPNGTTNGKPAPGYFHLGSMGARLEDLDPASVRLEKKYACRAHLIYACSQDQHCIEDWETEVRSAAPISDFGGRDLSASDKLTNFVIRAYMGGPKRENLKPNEKWMELWIPTRNEGDDCTRAINTLT